MKTYNVNNAIDQLAIQLREYANESKLNIQRSVRLAKNQLARDIDDALNDARDAIVELIENATLFDVDDSASDIVENALTENNDLLTLDDIDVRSDFDVNEYVEQSLSIALDAIDDELNSNVERLERLRKIEYNDIDDFVSDVDNAIDASFGFDSDEQRELIYDCVEPIETFDATQRNALLLSIVNAQPTIERSALRVAINNVRAIVARWTRS